MTSEIIAGTVRELPFFNPWIGGAYANRMYRRARGDIFDNGLWADHVMGDSHYAGDYPVTRDLTNRVICDWAFERQKGGRFFTGVLQTVQGREADEIDRTEGWSNLAFSNFAQRCVTGSRVSPGPDMWSEGRDCFFGQLSITRPRVLLVLGRRVWDQLPDDVGERVEPLSLNPSWQSVDDAWMYPYWTGDRLRFTLAVWVYHPSSSKFNWLAAHRRFQTAQMAYDNLCIVYAAAMATHKPPSRCLTYQ